MASASAPVAGAGAGGGKDDELADLVRRLVDALARYADRLPFDLDRQVRARICDPLPSVDAFFDRSMHRCGGFVGSGRLKTSPCLGKALLFTTIV